MSYYFYINNSGLLLYYYPFSYYSQKVLMTLYEKNIDFESKEVNLLNYEQYDSNFLYLNPKGEVPVMIVLGSENNILINSDNIMYFLDDTFSDDRFLPLLPRNREDNLQTIKMRDMFKRLPVDLLIIGVLIHQQYMRNPKMPYVGCFRKMQARRQKNLPNILRYYAEKHSKLPEAQIHMLMKAFFREQSYKEMKDENRFSQVLHKTGQILDVVEGELEKGQDWLCCEQFTLADVDLVMILECLSRLGLAHLFWSENQRPCLANYFEKAKKRDSYKKALPKNIHFYKSVLISQTSNILCFISGFALFVVAGIYVIRKFRD